MSTSSSTNVPETDFTGGLESKSSNSSSSSPMLELDALVSKISSGCGMEVAAVSGSSSVKKDNSPLELSTAVPTACSGASNSASLLTSSEKSPSPRKSPSSRKSPNSSSESARLLTICEVSCGCDSACESKSNSGSSIWSDSNGLVSDTSSFSVPTESSVI